MTAIDAQMTTLFNYTLTRAPEEVVAKIVEWHTRGRHEGGPAVAKRVIEAMRYNRTPQLDQLIVQAMKASRAQGMFLGEVSLSKRHNLVPSVLRNELASLIAGNTVMPTFMANYMALGTDSTPAVDGNTALGAETLRALFTDRSSSGNVAALDAFFSSGQVGGNTYSEAGIFVDGSAGADTGYLLSRVIINEAMGANETLTINATITIV